MAQLTTEVMDLAKRRDVDILSSVRGKNDANT
jgi:hypothetical protein